MTAAMPFSGFSSYSKRLPYCPRPRHSNQFSDTRPGRTSKRGKMIVADLDRDRLFQGAFPPAPTR